MLFLTALIIALAFAFLLDKPLKKHPAPFYAGAALLTVISIAVAQSDITITSTFVRDYVLGIFTRGALGAAMWAVVMWAGALPNGSAPIKKLMPIRGELSITAAILTLSHVTTYGILYVTNLIKGRTGSDFLVTSAVSLAMVAIMLPLTVMSVKAVRKKMNAKTWKKIQRLAYIFYALIYVHIMVLYVPRAQKGRDGALLSVLVYSAVFIGYAAMRLRKYWTSKKPQAKLAAGIVCAAAAVSAFVGVGLVSLDRSENTESTPEQQAVFTFTQPATSTTSATTSTATVGTSSSASTAAAETTTTATISTAPEDETEAATEETESAEETTAEELTEAQPVYKYRDGEYVGEAEGYAGKVHVKLTIESDVITGISAWADDDDPEYFGDAMSKVIPQIAASVSADGIDACSGATYSSKGLIEAARNALEQALAD